MITNHINLNRQGPRTTVGDQKFTDLPFKPDLDKVLNRTRNHSVTVH